MTACRVLRTAVVLPFVILPFVLAAHVMRQRLRQRTDSESRKKPSIASRLSRDGYVVLRGFLSAARVEEVRGECARVLDALPSRLTSGEVPRDWCQFDDVAVLETLKQVQQLSKIDAYFGMLMEELMQVAAAALGEEARAHNMQFFNKPPRLAYRRSAVHESSQPTPPHQDGFYWCHAHVPGRESGVTMWLALDEADEGNGCLRYVRGSSHKGLRPHAFSGVLGFSQQISDYVARDEDEIVMRARPGDLLIHNAMLVHRADANASEERTRRALGAIFFAASAVVDEERFEARKAEIAQRAAKLRGQ